MPFPIKCTTRRRTLQYHNTDSYRLDELKALEELYFVVYVLLYVTVRFKYEDRSFCKYIILRAPNPFTTYSNATCPARSNPIFMPLVLNNVNL